MTTSHDEQAPRFPIPRTCPFAAPGQYATLRAEAPVSQVRLPDESTAWLLTRHEDVRAALSDPRLSADRNAAGSPSRSFTGNDAPLPRSMLTMDGAEHAVARRRVLGEFTVRRINALRPRIQEIVDGFIDAMLAAGPPVDLVSALSLPVPSLVICELIGVPYADHEFFQSRSMTLVSRDHPAEAQRVAWDELMTYLDELVTAKEAAPGDDLLGRQIVQRRAAGEYEHADLHGLAFSLLFAGHETTANMISLGALALLTQPELRAGFDDPSRTGTAVEELLRYFSIVEGTTSRLAVADTEIGGQRIRAGEGVVALSLAANHDPEEFPDPEVISFSRATNHHVAFGFGPHQCLGQNLARTELQIVFETLCRRMPGLYLNAEIADVPVKDDAAFFGCYELPVAW